MSSLEVVREYLETSESSVWEDSRKGELEDALREIVMRLGKIKTKVDGVEISDQLRALLESFHKKRSGWTEFLKKAAVF